MHAGKVCHKWLSDVLPGMHQTRLSALAAAVGAALAGGRLSVTSLGRFLTSDAKVKHNIKRADRLCSNEHLQEECNEIYKQVCKRLVGDTKEPIILVDLSDIDARRKFFLLRAAVAVKGRSLTIYEEVHDTSTREKRATHRRFLEALKGILPRDCVPIIVTDAGFRGPWFKQVAALGWHYVGRMRNREMIELLPKNGWIRATSLYPKASSKPTYFSSVLLCRSNPLSCSLVLYKAKPKGRTRLTKMGMKARSRTSLVSAARANDPWLLATSLEDNRIVHAVQVYRTRMQIEESFRDLKCTRLGLGLYHNGTYKLSRMKVLVLIGSLASSFAWILGGVARSLNLDRQFQANSLRTDSVLSNVFVGIQIIRQARMKIPRIESKLPLLFTLPSVVRV